MNNQWFWYRIWLIPITRRASHSTRCTPFFCVLTSWWRTWLTQIPRISLISLWVGNLTEGGDAHDYMGFPIHRVLRVLYSLCLPRLNSYSWDLWDSWFSISLKFAQIFTNYFSLWFFIYLWLVKKIGCTGWCTLFFWSDRRDSNPRPSAWEANALPTEPLSHNVDIFIAPYGGLLLLNSLRRLLLRECRLLSRCRLLPMRQCCRGWVRDKRSRGVLFDRLQRRCCS